MVSGPASIPAIWSAVDHHATAADATNSATRPSRARCGKGGSELAPIRALAGGRSRDAHAAHENREVENAEVPSYWIPNASILERVAWATVSSEPAG